MEQMNVLRNIRLLVKKNRNITILVYLWNFSDFLPILQKECFFETKSRMG